MSAKRAIFIGGGFYGCASAIHLARQGWKVDILEAESKLMQRASFVNQARLHNGYHYPRSFQTAIRSRANLPEFKELYSEAVFDDFKPLYAIARYDSKVSAGGFAHFCKASGIPLRRASKEDRALFDHRLVEEVFEAEEPAFNAEALRENLSRIIPQLDIQVHTECRVRSVNPGMKANGDLSVETHTGEHFNAPWVFNCTYAALNHIDGANAPCVSLQHKISEVLLVKPPQALKDRGITLMDGPFFSIMPFPARGVHSLTHVRHTHHLSWQENAGDHTASENPLQVLDNYLNGHADGAWGRSKGPWMIRDAARYVPCIGQLEIVEPLIDVKTLITKTAVDDARPILFHRNPNMPGLISILGGKIDNIFDILGFVDELLLPEQ